VVVALIKDELLIQKINEFVKKSYFLKGEYKEIFVTTTGDLLSFVGLSVSQIIISEIRSPILKVN
jgi:hypothetical protein